MTRRNGASEWGPGEEAALRAAWVPDTNINLHVHGRQRSPR
jgi:hypothetical protein